MVVGWGFLVLLRVFSFVFSGLCGGGCYFGWGLVLGFSLGLWSGFRGVLFYCDYL